MERPDQEGLWEQRYRMLGVRVTLRSDSPDFLSLFDQDYEVFRVQSWEGEADCLLTVKIDGPLGGLVDVTFRTDDQGPSHNRVLLKGHPRPLLYALQVAVQRLFGVFQNFFLVHAGVVGEGINALLMAGGPGRGKTTLTLFLVSRGFAFLSDEYAPLERRTGLVHPFPRAAWLSKEAREMVPGFSNASPFPSSQARLSKMGIRMEALLGAIGVGPFFPRMLAYLDNGEGPGGLTTLQMSLKPEHREEVIRDLKTIQGVLVAPISPAPSDWKILYGSNHGRDAALAEHFKRHRDHIWNVYRTQDAPSVFDGPPKASPMAPHEAAFRLMGDLKQDFWGGDLHLLPGQILMELTDLLKDTACYCVKVGDLRETTTLLMGLWEGSRWRFSGPS